LRLPVDADDPHILHVAAVIGRFGPLKDRYVAEYEQAQTDSNHRQYAFGIEVYFHRSLL
jgi:hypothetical protein